MILNRSKFLSEGEHRELSEALATNAVVEFRNTTFLWMLLHTGSRVSEMLAVRGKDLNLESMDLFVRGLKNSNDRELPLTPFLYNRMKILAGEVGPDERIFPFGYSNARDIWLYYRPGKKKLHSLRHYRALEIYKKTKNVLLVKQVLGHKSLATTMIYLEYAQGREDIRQALM